MIYDAAAGPADKFIAICHSPQAEACMSKPTIPRVIAAWHVASASAIQLIGHLVKTCHRLLGTGVTICGHAP